MSLSDSDPPAVDDLASQIVEVLRACVQSRTAGEELPAQLDHIASLPELYSELLLIRKFLLAVAGGDLSTELKVKGYLGGALKTLQSHLKHLTWQTQMIAGGDFTQRVDFMGDFSVAFNSMVERLDSTLKRLKEKEEEITRSNHELMHEIGVRKKVEEALRKSEESFRQLAITDPLTGIYNRRHFFQMADHEIKRASRNGSSLAVIMFDIDFFKRVNDEYGHACGDLVLQKVASMAGEEFRSNDILARYGGEEFVVLLPDSDLENAGMPAERLRERIEKTPIAGEKGPVFVTTSFGVSACRPESGEVHILGRLVREADQALYEAKRSGRNRVVLADSRCDGGVSWQ
jgi:diguanylate cyclase (GGDEF)-like protein